MQGQLKSPKPQESQRLQADLERRAKELDARENYISQREGLLDTGPIDLNVLDESIRVKQGQLEQIKAAFLKKEKWYKERLDRLDEKLVVSKLELEVVLEKISGNVTVITFGETRIDELVEKEKAAHDTIAERKRYLDEQEHLIAETIDEGNATLRGIGYEITAAQEQRDQLNSEVAEVEVHKNEFSYELVQLEERAMHDKFNIENEIVALHAKVLDEGQKLADLKREQSKTTQFVDEKLRTLSIKETQLQTKIGALAKERQELDIDKRRWNSAKALYDI